MVVIPSYPAILIEHSQNELYIACLHSSIRIMYIKCKLYL